jgi:glutamyl-tRNA reductase
MRFSITGVNHKSAPVEVRERLAFDEPSLAAALLDLKSRPGFARA